MMLILLFITLMCIKFVGYLKITFLLRMTY